MGRYDANTNSGSLMIIFLIIVALLAGLIGFFYLTQATIGVGIICGACLLAIIARIVQASDQHAEMIQMTNAKNNQIEQGH